MDQGVRTGRILFAIAIVAFGVENVVCAHESEVVYSFAPSLHMLTIIPWLPAIPWLAYLVGVVLFGAGLSLAAGRAVRVAAALVAAVFLLNVVALQIPLTVGHPLDLSLRTTLLELLSLSAAALMLISSSPGDRLAWSGRLTFAVCAVAFGVTHLLIPRFIATLVPAWIPWHLFWGYFTGVAFIAAGVSIATGWLGRLGATLLGVMFLLWFLLLHLPRVLSLPGSHVPAEWSSAFIALGMCGASWICAQLLGRLRRT